MTGRTKIILSSLSLVLAAGGAQAQAPAAAAPAIAAGAKVTDPNGGEVGTVTSVANGNVVVKTDKYDVSLPVTSFAASNGVFLIALTRDQLNAETEKAMAAAGPVVTVGATVYDPQGGVVGTVQELDAELATVKLPNSVVKLPLNAFARGPNGPLIGETAAQLEAKVGAATGGQAAAASE